MFNYEDVKSLERHDENRDLIVHTLSTKEVTEPEVRGAYGTQVVVQVLNSRQIWFFMEREECLISRILS